LPSLNVRKISTGEDFVSTIGNKTPIDTIDREVAKRTRPVFFRRAVKLVNGGKIDLGLNATTNIPFGLTFASENPLYVQGNYNANAAVFNDVRSGACTGACEIKNGNHSVPAAIVADAVTLLSNSWTDKKSFDSPYKYHAGVGGVNNDAAGRVVDNHAYYRTAIIAGKNKAFPHSSTPPNLGVGDRGDEWGSDGGVHNFLRMLEYWTNTAPDNTRVAMYYDGSFVSLFYSQQANSAFKFKSQSTEASPAPVYSAPDRKYFFDSEFLNTDKLPPRTPMLRDINVLSFRRYTGDIEKE
jgi:hypothetical protein